MSTANGELALKDKNYVSSLLAEKENTGETVRIEASSDGYLKTVFNGYGKEGVGMSDAFGRFRTSSPYTLFDSKQLRDSMPLVFDDKQTSGSGTTSTFQTNKASTKLSVSNLTAGARVRQSFIRGNYQPGKGQLVFLTALCEGCAAGVKKRWGYFDSRNGLFFEMNGTSLGVVVRSYTSGSVVDTRIDQTSFNLDKLDGTGASGYTFISSKSTIFFIDFEWLGVGKIRFGIVDNGNYIFCHEISNSQVLTPSDVVYMSIPNLPIRYEIVNDGTGPESHLYHICSTIASEGGQEQTTTPYYISRNGVPITLANQDLYTPILSVRLKSVANSGTAPDVNGICARVVPTYVDIFSSSTTNYEWRLILSPTIAGVDAASWVNLTNTAIQYDVSRTNANTITGGFIVAGGYGASSVQVKASTFGIAKSFLSLGSNIDFTTQELVLCVANIDGNGGTVYGGISFEEFC